MVFSGSNFKKLINERGIKIVFLASKVGVSQTAIHKYISGAMTPRKPVQTLICQVLGVAIEELFTD